MDRARGVRGGGGLIPSQGQKESMCDGDGMFVCVCVYVMPLSVNMIAYLVQLALTSYSLLRFFLIELQGAFIIGEGEKSSEI